MSNDFSRPIDSLHGDERILILKKSGRCANGTERDSGAIYHAVSQNSWRAVCGAEPGRQSAGWSNDEGPAVTCTRCLRKIKTATVAV